MQIETPPAPTGTLSKTLEELRASIAAEPGDGLAGLLQTALLRLLATLAALIADFRAGRLPVLVPGAPPAAGAEAAPAPALRRNDEDLSKAQTWGWSFAALLWRPWIGTRASGNDGIDASEHAVRREVTASPARQAPGGDIDRDRGAGNVPAEPARAPNGTDGAIAHPSPEKSSATADATDLRFAGEATNHKRGARGYPPPQPPGSSPGAMPHSPLEGGVSFLRSLFERIKKPVLGAVLRHAQIVTIS
jgi:hypothetical protein